MNKGFDRGTQCVALKCSLEDNSEFHILIPRAITGVFVTAVMAAMSNAPEMREEENQVLNISGVETTLGPTGVPTLLFHMNENVRLPLQITPELLAVLKACLVELEGLIAPQKGAGH